MSSPLFYSKILLFGEYGIIKDSMGLSIPYNFYRGTLKLSDSVLSDNLAQSNQSLFRFYKHLYNLQQSGELLAELDFETFKKDIEAGLYFDSSIPQGFGVGSSGALCAALYDKYAIHKLSLESSDDKELILKLKNIFSQMESFFHGKSSGIDPLICYLNLPLLIKSKEDLGTVELPAQGQGEGAIFLLNTGMPGETQPMVSIFMEKMKNEGFRNILKEQFVKYNDACIQAFLKGDTSPLFSNLKKLSKWVLNHFAPMIPDHFHEVWQKGIDTNAYYLKLCGSGGGGYMLGFTRDMNKAEKLLEGHHPEIIFRF